MPSTRLVRRRLGSCILLGGSITCPSSMTPALAFRLTGMAAFRYGPKLVGSLRLSTEYTDTSYKSISNSLVNDDYS